MDFCYFISNMMNKGRFIALAAIWYRREKWGIGFDKDFVKWELFNDGPFFSRILVGDRSRNPDKEIVRKRILSRGKVAVE